MSAGQSLCQGAGSARSRVARACCRHVSSVFAIPAYTVLPADRSKPSFSVDCISRHLRIFGVLPTSCLPGMHSLTLAELSSTEKLDVTVYVDKGSIGPSIALPTFLLGLPPNRIREFVINYHYGYCERGQFKPDEPGGASLSIFEKLDGILSFSRFQRLEKVVVRLWGLLPDDKEHLAGMPLHDLPFRELRTRKVLELCVAGRGFISQFVTLVQTAY